MENKQVVTATDTSIKNRKTQKVLADDPWTVPSDLSELHRTIDALLQLASSAPYHKKCDTSYQEPENPLNSCVPWRAYTLDTKSCRSLLDHIIHEDIKAGKVGNMLAAADALIIVNWLPDPQDDMDIDGEKEAFPYEGNLRNMEHIAAASAAIQNILIGATARDIPNYWSSGGQLRNRPLRDHLDIPMNELMLGALFLFPKNASDRDVTIAEGKMRNQGKEMATWSRPIIL